MSMAAANAGCCLAFLIILHGSYWYWASVITCFSGKISWIVFWKMRRLEIYWPFMAPTEPGSIYGCMEFISLHVRKRYCLSAFYLNFCLCGFRFATTVGRMLLPLSAFIICFARMPFFVVSPYWKLRWWFRFVEWCFGKRHRLSAITRRLWYTQPLCCWQAQCLSFLSSLVQSCGHFHTFIHGDSASRSESFSARNIFSCSRFPETDRSRSLIILSLMNRTPPVFTIFHFSQTSADGSPRKRKQANGKCSLSQMAEPLNCQNTRQKPPRKCSLMHPTVSMPRG